jgi:K+-sensing histidine kinase KdpD
MTSDARPTVAPDDAADDAPSDGARLIRRFAPDGLAIVACLAAGALIVALLEQVAGFDNGSPAFLLAVVAVAVLRGTGPAVVTAIGSFLAYDFFFTAPHLTLAVADPAEWL